MGICDTCTVILLNLFLQETRICKKIIKFDVRSIVFEKNKKFKLIRKTLKK